ncbi:hypothetical protein [Streptomyces fuscichromogenes]|uniref:Uncharacterized protein n=1 Tax=Streptomyces fuscichromogenes TaxID=1324013 RepID=A0A917XPF2_9ACTN|nr:hypothetical protein [Streptomyces fuscichromogenes]GGN46439.1 hypothetical protein GCM10011578_099350 [Streptomyces fuscichromogenes]
MTDLRDHGGADEADDMGGVAHLGRASTAPATARLTPMNVKPAPHAVVMRLLTRTNSGMSQSSRGVWRLAMPSVKGRRIANVPQAVAASQAKERTSVWRDRDECGRARATAPTTMKYTMLLASRINASRSTPRRRSWNRSIGPETNPLTAPNASRRTPTRSRRRSR